MAAGVPSSSCLSPGVYHMICEAGVSAGRSMMAPETRYLDADGFIQWEVIAQDLPDPIRPEGTETEAYFVRCVQSLSPVMAEIHSVYSQLSARDVQDKLQYTAWTACQQVITSCLERCRSSHSAQDSLQTLLLTTAVLERSLGDLFQRSRLPVPSLLKDLLVTPQLRALLGATPIHLLRTLIGPPISLNLRNVAWHGFISPAEVHPQYTCTLLAVIVTLGRHLRLKGIDQSECHRSPATFPQILKIRSKELWDLPDADCAQILAEIQDSPFIQDTMAAVWTQAFHEYTQQNYLASASLLLPQLEHGLRLMFADVNGCPQRVLTAEILSPELEDGTTNKLRSYIGDNLLMLLLDVLVYPGGPRVRDRISHGEAVTPGSVTRGVAGCVACVCVTMAAWYKQSKSKTLVKNSKLKELLEWSSSYQSRCHPITGVKDKVKKCAKSLDKWHTIPRPSSEEIETTVSWDAVSSSDPDDLAEVLSLYLDQTAGSLPWTLDTRLLRPFSDLASDLEAYISVHISTLYRNHGKQGSREEEIVGLLDRVLHQSHLVSDQVVTVATQRHSQLCDKLLRSRQRKTYARMLDCLPRLSSALCLCLVMCVVCLYSLDTASNESQTSTVTLLKLLLQYTENLRSLTAGDKNRWDEAAGRTEGVVGRARGIVTGTQRS